MITAYYKLELLSNEIKAINGIRSKHRLDCTSYFDNTEEGYRGLDMFVNKKGHLAFYKTPNRSFLNPERKRISEYSLTNNYNFSSIYIEDLDYPEYAYGYPNANLKIGSKGELNPAYPYRQDGYLFILNKDYTQIEILVIEGGRNLISSYYQSLIDGDFEETLNENRRKSQGFFNYKWVA